jgi:hypothetical protein
MPATEIEVTSAGSMAGNELLVPTGKQGSTYAHLQDWLGPKLKAKAAPKDISKKVLVKGIKQWAVFEEKAAGRTLRTVFKIT